MTKLFISHSSQDDAFVRELRATLADHGQPGWIDSRELRGGDPLWTEIRKAIEEASAYAVVVSTDALQSEWVGKELRHALLVRQRRGSPSPLRRLYQFIFQRQRRGGDQYPVIPLSLNGTKLGVLEEFFGEEPTYIPVSSDAGGVEAAMNPILVALGKRLPADVTPTPQPKAEPLEELVLELTDLKFHEQDGVRRASAKARLVYEPATPGQPDVHSAQHWRLVAPIGPIEAEELRWYLEKYAVWPSHYFRDRARKVEEDLVKWGKLLHEAAMPVTYTANVMNAWARIGDHAGRRFSVQVDATLEAGAPEADVKAAQEAATLLLGLPWELLHDGKSYLFQGAKPTRVRRRLPGTEGFGVPVVTTPIRILLVTARPEDDACGYIDHRASALPLVEAMEALPGLVKLHVLSPPTLPALREELDRARRDNKPYHVVHFDGHGVYDRSVGLGGLCFENPEYTGKLEKRRHVTVFTSELGPLLRDYRIPLVFLEACQTAQAEQASESVASELLKVGVASVVAMSHSVLVETSRRFVEAFYKALAGGRRVGDAMLEGQRKLKDDSFRGRIFGAGELHLEDWFVPVLFQEKDDPQLFKTTPAKQTVEGFKAALAARLGKQPNEPKIGVPDEPETTFVGRSRELLALMAEMDQQIAHLPADDPRRREKSVFASVELSLRRLSEANRDRARVLGVFHGGVDMDALAMMMQWEKADVVALAGELVQTGLATPNRYNHLTLNPALCPYLRGRMDSAEREALTARWVEAMRAYAGFLEQQRSQNAEFAATLTVLELPNLFALLDLVQRAGDGSATIDLATSLYGLLQFAGKPRLLERVEQVRDAAAAALGDAWNHARFQAARTRIEQQLAGGRLRGAFEGAQALLQRARVAGEQAYPDADYDLAVACFLLARVLKTAGGAEQALPRLDEARRRFEAVAKERANKAAEDMASVCFAEQGDCLLALGRLDEAAAAHEERIRHAEQLGDDRGVAVGKGQLGTVRLEQRRYAEALVAYEEALARFTALDEPGSVATIWHQTGMVYQQAGQPEAAEDAYRKSLTIEVRLGNVAGQASTLAQLGILYDNALGRTEEAIAFLRQAVDKYVEIRDVAGEGRNRNNLAMRLRKLRRFDEARQENRRAIECDAQFGHASEPWKTWAILADIETGAGNPAAAAGAKGKAIACYLAYRRDGGENHFPDGRICLAVTQSLRAGNPAQAASRLQQLAANPDAAWLLPFIRALQAIVAGSRDRTLADAPELDYSMAAEILFLIETLENAGS